MPEENIPTLTNDAKIEAILFFKGEPVKRKKLAEILSISEKEIDAAITVLHEKLRTRGLRLISKEDMLELRSAPEAGKIIENIIKDDISKDLGKAGTETLAIILYRGPVPKRDIDYIRGVNSSFILRNLMIRGLVERVTNKNDARSFVYKPTTELLAHLGVSKKEELPEYGQVHIEVQKFEDFQKEKNDETEV